MASQSSPSQNTRRILTGSMSAAMAIASLGVSTAQAATYYWDVNGSGTAGFGTVVGAWNGTNPFWNTSSGGTTGGTVTATVGSADDLIIPPATTNTGSLTVNGAQSASSITFAANVGPTTTITGGTSITIGGTGAASGIFEQSTGANTIATALILNSTVSAFNFGNTSVGGLLTIGAVTGSAAGPQTINVASSNTGGITLSGVIGNGGGGGSVALAINNTGTGTTTLSGASTFTGGVTLTAGTLAANTSASALGVGALTLNGGTLRLNGGSGLAFNRDTTIGGNASIVSERLTANGGVTYTMGALNIGANTLTVGGGNINAGTAGLTFTGAVNVTGAATFTVNNPAIVGTATQLTMTGGVNNNGNLLTVGGTGVTSFSTSANTNVITGGGGLTKNGTGVLILSGSTGSITPAHTYTGTTTINDGVVRIQNDAGSTGTGNLTINGGVLEAYFAGTWTRTLGAGGGEVQILGGASGFGGQGATASVFTLGTSGSVVQWGSAFFNPSVFVLQASTANTNGRITLDNGLDLNATTRTIAVNGTDPTLGSGATITGVISNSSGTAGLIKTGVGGLSLEGGSVNTYDGGTTVNGGRLSVGSATSLGANLNTNNIGVSAGASLTLAAAANSGSNQTITLTSTVNGLALLGLGFNGLPNGPLAQANTNGGVFAINAVAGFDADLAPILSSRNLYLGAIGITTFTGAVGTVVAGNGFLYRLGGGGGQITFGTTNLFTGGNGVQIGSPATNGGGTVVFDAAQDYTGATAVAAGSTFTLSGGGALALSSSPIAIMGGNFNMGDGSGTAGTNHNDRIADTQAITLSGGNLVLRSTAVAATDTTETIGAISRAAGSGTVTVVFGGTNVAALTAASLAHTAGEGVTLVNGTSLGKDTASTASVGRFILTAAPTLAGTTPAADTGINSAFKNTQIVPYLLGEAATATGGLGTQTGTANTFVTYHPSTGLRPLNPTDEFTGNAYTSGNNIRITAATPASASASINSLLVTSTAASAVSITNASTLTVTSGAVLFTGNGATVTGTAGNILSFGSSEALITTNSGVTATISAEIAGSGGLTKSGSGDLNLSGVNPNLTGAVNINAGILRLDAPGTSLGSTSGVNIASGASLFVRTTSATFSSGQALTLNGTGATGTGALVTSTSGTTIWNGAVTLGSNSLVLTGGGTVLNIGGTINLNSFILTANAGAATTFSNTISGTGGITKSGASTLTLSGANDYTGASTISAGTLSLGNGSALGGGIPGVNGTSSIAIAGGAALSTSTDAITIVAPITLGTVNTNSTIAFGRNTTATGTLTLNGGISGAGNLTLSTPNVSSGGSVQTILLGSATTYAGNTTITTGNGNNALTVRAAVANALPVTTVLTLDGGAGSGSGRAVTYDLNGNNQTLAGLNTVAGYNAYIARNQRITSGPAAILTINGSGNSSYGGAGTSSTFNGNPVNPTATIGGAISLVKNGTGTFTLTGAANSFTGSTTVLGGILSLGHTRSLQSSAFDTAASVSGDATNGLRATVTTLTLGGLTGNKNFADIFTTTAGGYDSVTALTLNLGTGVTHSYSGVIANGATGMTLTKTGAGTQVLSGTDTYTGVTTVSAGTLIFGVSETLSGLDIADSAVVILGTTPPAPAPSEGGAAAFFADGESIGGGFSAEGGAVAAAAVPEPGSMALLIGGALALLGVRRRREA